MRGLLLGLALFLASCMHIGSREPGDATEFFHWQPASAPSGWLIFLPGSSGLSIFGDERHYFSAAERLNEGGWSVLLVDYRPAYRAADVALEGNAGDKIAWVTEQAVEWLHDQHPETATQPGGIVAWSMGAEGALRLANDEGRAEALGVRAISLYYPSIRDVETLDSRLPLLVLTGAADDVTPATGIQELIQPRSLPAPSVELHVYPGAHHGFDVASIQSRKTVRPFLFFGPRATLQYDERAADDAEDRLATFLANHVLQPTPANGAAER